MHLEVEARQQQTDDYKAEEKAHHHNRLLRVYQRQQRRGQRLLELTVGGSKATRRHDLLIVMGDLNAKVGWDNTDNERMMGMHGIETRSENGKTRQILR